jgi:hypothetical protein
MNFTHLLRVSITQGRLVSLKGQSSVEYLIVCAALAFALGVGMWNDTSVLRELLQAFREAYEKISYSLSIPL